MALNMHTLVTWPTLSGVPQDAVVMGFSASKATDWVTSDFTTWEANIAQFFQTVATGGVNPVASYMGPQLSRAGGAITCRTYALDGHLAGSPHGSPVHTGVITVSAAASTTGNPPSECAVCLSIHGTYGTDVEFAPGARPRSRDRGRIFLGPLSSAVLATDATTKRPFVSAQCRTDVTLSADRLRTAVGPTWCVWSRKNAVLVPVVGGWIDDAFDTQRRRGEKASLRTTFGALV